MDPYGGWSEPQQLFPGYVGSDTNFAPVILPNGSFVGLWRHWGGGNGGSRQLLATGSVWEDTSSYVRHHTELFPDHGGAGAADQFAYQDEDDFFHAWFHHMYGSGTKNQWWLDAAGGHAFSRDGWTWTYTVVAWGSPLRRYNTAAGHGAAITFDDGTDVKFTRVERPHLVCAGQQLKGDPIFATISAQYGMGTNPGTGASNGGACFTLAMPVVRDREDVSVWW